MRPGCLDIEKLPEPAGGPDFSAVEGGRRWVERLQHMESTDVDTLDRMPYRMAR